MNKVELVRAKCPFFKDVDRTNKQIVCGDEMAPYSQIRIVFPTPPERASWSYDYCDGYMYDKCPMFTAIKSEIE